MDATPKTQARNPVTLPALIEVHRRVIDGVTIKRAALDAGIDRATYHRNRAWLEENWPALSPKNDGPISQTPEPGQTRGHKASKDTQGAA